MIKKKELAIIRTTIHSSDFSSGSYTYIEEGDAALKNVQYSHDKEFRIPLIKKSNCGSRRKSNFIC
jgi:glucosylceramidase